ncbi:enoyl-CoA hydratase/isomerase family protein [Diplocloster hominis]|uniref:enoyl-CoA hydratase/isomerase family protein n=1 Tax=Diplocloster hominis TaxID=3079010 RepID=UPI0031BB794C
MAYETLIYEKQDKIAVITLNRPECLNAFNNISFQEIKAAIIEAGDDPDIRVIVLKGSERAFSAGDDIKYMTSGAVTDGDVWTALMQECVGEISRCKKPVIAAVSGVAMGGGFELALMCDMIYVAEGTKLALPEIKIGAIPICGGISKVAKCAGSKWAKYLAMTGDTIAPELAFQLGLVQKVVPADKLLEEVMILAGKLAMMPVEMLSVVKRVADVSEDMTNERGLIAERDYMNYISRIGVGAEAAKAWMAAKKKK